MPRLIEAVRLSLGPAFLFLISAEAIAADVGLGYRIFLVRRYLAMDVILPYVAWITLIAYLMDFALARLARGGLRLGLCRGAALMSALSLRDVWVEYGDQVVLERINLDIAAGAFLSVVGPSGAGKSTFLRLILGQERPTRGAILIDGEPLPAEPGPDRGVVFQRYSVFPHLTVLGNVLLAFEFAQSPWLCRLTGAARRRGDGGERQPDRGGRAQAASRQISERPLRRHAAAPRHRPGDRAEAQGAPARRAVRRARPRHPHPDARSSSSRSGGRAA